MGSLTRSFLLISLLIPVEDVIARVVASRDWSSASDVYDAKRCGLPVRGSKNDAGGFSRRRGLVNAPIMANHYETTQMNHLQVLEMDGGLLSRADCEGKLSSGGQKWTLPADGICTDEWKKKDTCAGDSGGGLITRDPSASRYFLVGVVSFGRDCTALIMGNTPRAQVFTSVMAHTPEIDAFIAGR